MFREPPQVQAHISSTTKSQFCYRSRTPRGNTSRVKRPPRRQFFLGPSRTIRPAITTFFGTFTTAGFFPSYRTLLMIIIKDFLHVDPEFSARRDSARVGNADKIYRPRCISFPIEYILKCFRLFPCISLPKIGEPTLVNHWRISNVLWRKSVQSWKAFRIILSWRKMWRVMSLSSLSIQRWIIHFFLNLYLKCNSKNIKPLHPQYLCKLWNFS